MRNKRYELLVKDNLSRYNKDKAALSSELKQAKNETTLIKNKINVLENEASFKEESQIKSQEALNKVNRQMMALQEENLLLKQSLKGLTMQAETVMVGFLKQV